MYNEFTHFAVEGSVDVASGYTTSRTVEWFSPYVGFFEVVPTGMTLTITDVLLNPEENVTAAHRVCLFDGFPNGGGEIFFELRAQPLTTRQAHLLTGYVIQPGHKVISFTLALPPANQSMVVWLTGYVPKPWAWWWSRARYTRKPRMIRPNVPAAA